MFVRQVEAMSADDVDHRVRELDVVEDFPLDPVTNLAAIGLQLPSDTQSVLGKAPSVGFRAGDHPGLLGCGFRVLLVFLVWCPLNPSPDWYIFQTVLEATCQASFIGPPENVRSWRALHFCLLHFLVVRLLRAYVRERATAYAAAGSTCSSVDWNGPAMFSITQASRSR